MISRCQNVTPKEENGGEIAADIKKMCIRDRVTSVNDCIAALAKKSREAGFETVGFAGMYQDLSLIQI